MKIMQHSEVFIRIRRTILATVDAQNSLGNFQEIPSIHHKINKSSLSVTETTIHMDKYFLMKVQHHGQPFILAC